MNDEDKTKEQLVAELIELRHRVTEREAGAEHKRVGGHLPMSDKPNISTCVPEFMFQSPMM